MNNNITENLDKKIKDYGFDLVGYKLDTQKEHLLKLIEDPNIMDNNTFFSAFLIEVSDGIIRIYYKNNFIQKINIEYKKILPINVKNLKKDFLIMEFDTLDKYINDLIYILSHYYPDLVQKKIKVNVLDDDAEEKIETYLWKMEDKSGAEFIFNSFLTKDALRDFINRVTMKNADNILFIVNDDLYADEGFCININKNEYLMINNLYISKDEDNTMAKLSLRFSRIEIEHKKKT